MSAWMQNSRDLGNRLSIIWNMFQYVIANNEIDRIFWIWEIREILLFSIGIIVVSVDSKVLNMKSGFDSLLDTSFWRDVKYTTTRTEYSLPANYIKPKETVSFKGAAARASCISSPAKAKWRESAIPTVTNGAMVTRS